MMFLPPFPAVALSPPVVTVQSAPRPEVPMDPRGSIGAATMAADGTIVLQLRAVGTGPHPIIGDGRITYAPADPQYQAVLRHLGGLRPGETKPVPPWPDPG